MDQGFWTASRGFVEAQRARDKEDNALVPDSMKSSKIGESAQITRVNKRIGPNPYAPKHTKHQSNALQAITSPSRSHVSPRESPSTQSRFRISSYKFAAHFPPNKSTTKKFDQKFADILGVRNPNLNGCGSENDDDHDFSFSTYDGSSTADPADEIFSNGKILPLYPLFNRTLLLSDPDPNVSDLRSESASSTWSAASAETDATQNYREWNPNRDWKKTPSKWWRVRDLVGGKRSHNDGKEKLGHLNSSSKLDSGRLGSGKKTEMDLVTAHKLFYGKEKGGGGAKSFLPYKPELVGLFTKGRARHPNPFNL